MYALDVKIANNHKFECLEFLITNTSETQIIGDLLLNNDKQEYLAVLKNYTFNPRQNLKYILFYEILGEMHQFDRFYISSRLDNSQLSDISSAISYDEISTDTFLDNPPLKKILLDTANKLFCQGVVPVVYSNHVYPPRVNGVYEKKLAEGCMDICLAVSLSICSNEVLENPPGFNRHLCIKGLDPNTGLMSMYAYIFWNEDTKCACFSFTATMTCSQLISDLDYSQIFPQELSYNEPEMLIHRGFYNIYLSIRYKLWRWWNVNKHWVENLFITGHSLGGALSTISSLDFSGECNCGHDYSPQKPDLIHYSFGAPKSGNYAYANVFNKRVSTSIRVCNLSDSIIYLPPDVADNWEYKHTAGDLYFEKDLNSHTRNHTEAYIYYMPDY